MFGRLKKNIILLAAAVMFAAVFLYITADFTAPESNYHIIVSDEEITANGRVLTNRGDIYLSNDVVYYEDRDFYDSGNIYGEGTDSDKHSAEDAAAVSVLNITKPGTYRLSGHLSHGQIRVDLGKNAYKDKNAVVNLILDGLDINCSVAPAVVFKNVYECGGEADINTASRKVDTSEAGANIIIADGSINNICGSHVAKIYKDGLQTKKLCKQDAALYSYMTLTIGGENDNSGVLNINADNEGICTERHLTINSGNINIIALNDGINTNEEYISVTTINDGHINIIGGIGENYGDGIDSNGWISINGGTVVSVGHMATDSGVDSNITCIVDGGTLISVGGMVDWPSERSDQNTLMLQFKEPVSAKNALVVTDTSGNVVFAWDSAKNSTVGNFIGDCLGIAISSSDFVPGENYYLYLGGCISGDETDGIYNPQTVTGFSGAKKQIYYSDEMFGTGGFTPDENKEYTACDVFGFQSVVNCFAEVASAEN